MSQILNLLNLPPSVQEGLVLGDLHLGERRVRAVVAAGGSGRNSRRDLSALTNYNYPHPLSPPIGGAAIRSSSGVP